jgi:hypothetical protein
MKKLLVTLTAVLVSVSTFGQGTIFFNNRTSAGDVRIYAPGGVNGAGTAAPSVTAQLFLQTAPGVYSALTPATTFRTGAAASFFVNPLDVVVPGVAAGTPATVIIRAWDTAAGSYDAAALRGESQPLTISGLGGVNPQTGAIVPTPDLAGLQSFTLVPEPSTIALGVLGAAALLYRRRK